MSAHSSLNMSNVEQPVSFCNTTLDSLFIVKGLNEFIFKNFFKVLLGIIAGI